MGLVILIPRTIFDKRIKMLFIEEVRANLIHKAKSRRECGRLLLLGLMMILPILLCTAARNNFIKKSGVTEQAGKANVAFLGSSAMYRYIIPQLLWKEDGITSCLIGRPAEPFDEMPTQIEIAMQSSQPTLYVIEIRRLIMNDIERKNEKIKQNILNDQKGVPAVQNGIDQFLRQINWPWLNNEPDGGPQNLSGEILTIGSVKREKQWDPSVDRNKTTPLEQQSLDTLNKVLDICKKYRLNVLFVSTPYVEKPAFIREENTAAQVIARAGFAYHNYNYDYGALGLDFWKDYYDQRHVNISGAIKMTNAMAAYLKGERILYGDTASTSAYWAENYRIWTRKSAAQQRKIQLALKNRNNAGSSKNILQDKLK